VVALVVGLIPVLLACHQKSGLYAERSAPPAASAAHGDTPWYIGRWAAAADQCDDPLVFAARKLDSRSVDCDFDKVEASQAGYAVYAVCRGDAGIKPTRLSIVTPDQARVSTLTISGGPFANAVALRRCAAQ
jgi:hypothetical protein